VYEAIRAGAIPVLLGGDRLEMAYGEVVDWHKAALFLPKVCYSFITVIRVGEKGRMCTGDRTLPDTHAVEKQQKSFSLFGMKFEVVCCHCLPFLICLKCYIKQGSLSG
jgi:hypothetical protein